MIRCGRWMAVLAAMGCGACAAPQVPVVTAVPGAWPTSPGQDSTPEPPLAAVVTDGSTRPADAAPPAASSAPAATTAYAAPMPDSASRPRLPDHPALAAIGAPDALQASRLVGKTVPDLEGLFGRAHFIRVDKDSELRQYRNTGCVLDLFLYPDPKTRIPKVAYADVRSRQGGQPDENACLADLLRAHWMPGA